jgi:hypothetical protein
MSTVAAIYCSNEAWSDWPESLYRIRVFSSMYSDHGLDIQRLRLRLAEVVCDANGRPSEDARSQILRQIEAYYTSHLDENGEFDVDTAPRPAYEFVVSAWEEEYYSPSSLSADVWGFWDDEDSWDPESCDESGRRAWTKQEWQEELSRQAWDLLDAHVGPAESDEACDPLTKLYNKMIVCTFWAQVIHGQTPDPRKEL